MYKLTDFSLKELRVLNASVARSIRDKKDDVALIERNLPEECETRTTILNNASAGLPELRTWSVQIHNAIDIVKQRETTHAN